MQAFTPMQLPVLRALAANFALCDHWFSSMPGPTWPNRFFAHAGSSAGLDDSPHPLRTVTSILDGFHFPNGVIYDRLEHAGLEWHIVEGDALPQALAIEGMIDRSLDGRFLTHDEFLEQLKDPAFADAYVFIEPHYGDSIADGRTFKCGNSQHPQDDVTRGEAFLKEIYDAIFLNSPHWHNSVLIVCYDEHGGFYDHLLPPSTIPPGDPASPQLNNQHRFAFDQLGVRVPAVVVSAWTPPGLVDPTQRDHTAILATLREVFQLEPLTDRDRHASSLTQLLPLASPRSPMPTIPDSASSGIRDCEDSLIHRLAGDLLSLPAEVTELFSRPPEPPLLEFVHVALVRDLHMASASAGQVTTARAATQARLEDVYSGIRTRHDALKYLRDVEKRYEELRATGGHRR
jgi:phospholipase C